jgi:hypothetical protein
VAMSGGPTGSRRASLTSGMYDDQQQFYSMTLLKRLTPSLPLFESVAASEPPRKRNLWDVACVALTELDEA